MSTTIIRATRRDRSFTIDQRTIEDEYLSWAARGLLCYLLSRPDDWELRTDELCGSGNLRRDGIYRLLRELREAGYLYHEDERDKRGRIRGGTYYIYETLENPDTDVPDTDRQGSTAPHFATVETLESSGKGAGDGATGDLDVEFIGWVPEEVRDRALQEVASLDPEGAQVVIDEWAGRVGCGMVNVTPFVDLRALVDEYREGCMARVFAKNIKIIRAKPVPEGGYVTELVEWNS